MQPLISIALCTYNGEKYLSNQLTSIADQTYSNLEIIIVDDNSSDNTIQILKNFSQKDLRVKLHFNKKNIGYVKNFEKAINLCTGKYIALSDQDDIWDKNKIRLLVENIGTASLIYHNSTFVDFNGKIIGKMSDILNPYQGNSTLPFWFYNCISGHSCMFNSELVSKIGAFDKNFYHDWWIAFVAASQDGIKYIDNTLVEYRQHSNANTDILNLNLKKLKSVEKAPELNILWLKNCLRIATKDTSTISRIIWLSERRSPQHYLQLTKIFLSNFNQLYYIKKKKLFSKLNYVRKMVFGRRVKNDQILKDSF